jgi:hypothetical protein
MKSVLGFSFTGNGQRKKIKEGPGVSRSRYEHYKGKGQGVND